MKQLVISGILMGVAIALILTLFPNSAHAKSCHRQRGHEICLQRIQRSAKYHWQYRVKGSLDGELQPLTLYNCRDRLQIPLEGPEKSSTRKFVPLGVGEFVCQMVNH